MHDLRRDRGHEPGQLGVVNFVLANQDLLSALAQVCRYYYHLKY